MASNDPEKLIGKREPLPGSGKPVGANWAPPAASAPPAKEKDGVGALPGNPVTNPRAIIEGRMQKAGMAKGGLVRGTGAALRGKNFNGNV